MLTFSINQREQDIFRKTILKELSKSKEYNEKTLNQITGYALYKSTEKKNRSLQSYLYTEEWDENRVKNKQLCNAESLDKFIEAIDESKLNFKGWVVLDDYSTIFNSEQDDKLLYERLINICEEKYHFNLEEYIYMALIGNKETIRNLKNRMQKVFQNFNETDILELNRILKNKLVEGYYYNDIENKEEQVFQKVKNQIYTECGIDLEKYIYDSCLTYNPILERKTKIQRWFDGFGKEYKENVVKIINTKMTQSNYIQYLKEKYD